MRTTTPARRADVRDPRGITGWPKDKGRDGERTPMQWTPGRQAGFSTAAETWLPVAENHRTINVQSERSDPESLLNWYRRLIQLRRTVPALRSGSWRAVDTANRAVLAYLREAPGHPAILVALNMSAADQSVSYARVSERLGPGEIRTLASNVRQLRDVRSVGSLKLPAYCALVLEIGGKQAEAPTDAARTRIPISAPIVRRPRGRS
jgi:alpha-glucosidase